jgi:hypothetical protein
MNHVRITRILAAAAVGLLSIAATKSNKSSSSSNAPAGPKHSPFVTVVMRNWSAWDADHDGTLTQAEIERAVMDPKVTGEDAAAAAALESFIRSKKITLPPLTKAYFEAYDAHASVPKVSDEEAAKATIDPSTTGVTTVPGTATPHWDMMFAGNKHRIAAIDANANLGATAPTEPGPEVLTHMHQGPLGDCFFVAVIGAAENRNPALIHSMLTTLPGGKIRVAFPSPFTPYVLSPVTDAERALSSSSGGQGDWLVALEQAYGRYRHQLAGGADVIEGTDTVCHGGSEGTVMATLTGHSPNWFNLPNDAAKRKVKQDQLLPKLRTDLANAFSEHRLVVASVNGAPKPPDGKTDPKPTTGGGGDNDNTDPKTETASAALPSPPNITHGHAYAVTAYDAKTDTITIWNPHGQTFHPKGPDGLTNGYTTAKGTFKLPLAEAYQFYSSFCIESTRTAKPPAPASEQKSTGKH